MTCLPGWVWPAYLLSAMLAAVWMACNLNAAQAVGAVDPPRTWRGLGEDLGLLVAGMLLGPITLGALGLVWFAMRRG